MDAQRQLKQLLLVGFFLLLGSKAKAQQNDVYKAVEELRVLMINPDKAKLDALAHPELSYGHSSGKLENKAEFIETLVSKKSDFRRIDFLDQTVFVQKNTAIVRHILEADTFDGGKEGKVKLKILLVWVKEKKAWKLLARQAVKFQ